MLDVLDPHAAALPALANALNDPDPLVMRQASVAIERIAPKRPSSAPVARLL